jgi:signal peptidase II
MQRRYKTAFSLALLVLVLDQASKLWVLASLPRGDSHTVIPGFFNLVHVLNRGAAFGFLNTPDITWQRTFFIAASLLAVALIVHLLRSSRQESPLLFTGLGLILGGALGNLVDRVRLGVVIDYLDFHVGQYHWPAFNVADSAITTGAVCLLLSLYSRRGRRADHEEK